MIQSPMEYWHMNLSLMEESDDIKQTATCVESTVTTLPKRMYLFSSFLKKSHA